MTLEWIDQKRWLLIAAIESLPMDQQLVMSMFYEHRMSLQAIEQNMQRPLNEVSELFYLAHQTLKPYTDAKE